MVEYHVLALANQSTVVDADSAEEAVAQARDKFDGMSGGFEMSYIASHTAEEPSDTADWTR